MKKTALLFLLFPVGLALIFLNGMLAPLLDRTFYPAEVLLGQSSEFYKQGNLDAFENSLKDFILHEQSSPKLRSLAFYNLGNVSLQKAQKGDPVAARDAVFYFKEALRNDPFLFPAKYNLELLLKRRQKDGQEQERSRSSASKTPQTEKEEKEMLKKGITTQPPILGSTP